MPDAPLVPQFQDLTMVAAADRFDEVTAALADECQPPWARDPEREALSATYGNEIRAAYHRDADDTLPELHVFLVPSKGSITVPNIIPAEHSLTEAQYNTALVEFADLIVRPVAARLNIDLDVTDSEVDFEDLLPHESFRALYAFSRAANKSSGSSHPMDRARWFDFMVKLEDARFELDTELLMRWLVLDGWSEDMASTLVIEFEFGIGLLRYVNNH